MGTDPLEAFRAQVHGDDFGSEGCGELDAEASDSPNADENGEITRR
jgi:hypothetical protein